MNSEETASGREAKNQRAESNGTYGSKGYLASLLEASYTLLILVADMVDERIEGERMGNVPTAKCFES